MQHLWEIEHPYYWNEGCFYTTGNDLQCGSWADFIATMGDSDDDLNLLCRFDWRRGEDWDLADGEGELFLGYVAQRKAYTFSYTVKVRESDEPAIREWLKAKWAKIQAIWAPFSEDTTHVNG